MITCLKHRLIVPSALMLAVAMTACNSYDDLRLCPYDKFFEETLDGDRLELYNRAYAVFRSTDYTVVHDAESLAGCNIKGTDGTMSDFIRCLFDINELASDEAICAWGDSGVTKFISDRPQEVSPSTAGFFLRLLSGIRIADTYISKYAGEDEQKDAEMRLLRALFHLYMLDTFGDCGESVGLPADVSAFDFIEEETKKSCLDLPMPEKCDEKSPMYGLMNRGVAKCVLMRLYLNSEVYTNRPRFADALKIAQEIIDWGVYSLSDKPSVVMSKDKTLFTWTPYQKLFMADNGRNGAHVEAILPLLYDSDTICSYGGTSFLCGSTFDGMMYTVTSLDTLGQTNGTTLSWGGNRVRPELIRRFTREPIDNADTKDFQQMVGDDRALFFSKGRSMEIDDYAKFFEGYSTTKFNSLYAEGTGARLTCSFSSSDFFLIRYAEVLLTAAECSWRLGDNVSAARYVNVLRKRACARELIPDQIDEKLILDEWSREFYFEGRRRTDLIRFDSYYGNKAPLWTWKGGEKNGKELPADFQNFDQPDTASVGARYLKLYNFQRFKQPMDMYYICGDGGITQNKWDVRGGENFGLGIIPFANCDTDVVLIEYLTPRMHFKLIGEIGLWDEQYGSGDYGSFLHNETCCEAIDVPVSGLYRLAVDRKKDQLTVLRYFGVSNDVNTLSVVLSDGRRTVFNLCSPNNLKSRNWMADIMTDGRDSTHFSILRDGYDVKALDRTYGVELSQDGKGRFSVPPTTDRRRLRLIYNDILNSLYLYLLEDK